MRGVWTRLIAMVSAGVLAVGLVVASAPPAGAATEPEIAATFRVPGSVYSQGSSSVTISWRNTTDREVWAPIYRLRSWGAIGTVNTPFELGDVFLSPVVEVPLGDPAPAIGRIPAGASGTITVPFRMSKAALDGFPVDEPRGHDPLGRDRYGFIVDVLAPDSDQLATVRNVFAAPLASVADSDRNAVIAGLYDTYAQGGMFTTGHFTEGLQRLRQRIGGDRGEVIDMPALLTTAVAEVVAELPDPSVHGWLQGGAGNSVNRLLRIEPDCTVAERDAGDCTRYLRTGPNGSFAARHLPDGETKIYLDGHGPDPIATITAPHAVALPLAVPSWPTVTGTVRNAHGVTAAPGATVTIRPRGAAAHPTDWVRVVADDAGRFEIPGVKPGAYTADVYFDAERNDSQVEFTVAAGGAQQVDIELRQIFRLRVVNNRTGVPVDGVVVRSLNDPDVDVRNDGDGYVMLSDYGTRTYQTLQFSAPGFATHQQTVFLHPGIDSWGRPSTTLRQIGMTPAETISGTVTDSDGQPVPGATVRARQFSDANEVDIALDAFADEEGHFSIPVDTARVTRLEISASAAGHEIAPKTVAWPRNTAGASLPRADVGMRALAWVEVSVRDGGGAPLAGVYVTATRDGAAPGAGVESTETAQDGVAPLSLTEGTWAIASPGLPSQSVTVSRAVGCAAGDDGYLGLDPSGDEVCLPTVAVQFIDNRPTLSGSLPDTSADGRTAPTAHAPVWLRDAVGAWTSTIADANGNFTLRAAPGTTGTIWVFDPYLGVLSRDVSFGAAGSSASIGTLAASGVEMAIPIELMRDPNAGFDADPYRDHDGMLPLVYIQPQEFADGTAIEGIPMVPGAGLGTWLLPSGSPGDWVTYLGDTENGAGGTPGTGVLTAANIPPGRYRVTMVAANTADRIAEVEVHAGGSDVVGFDEPETKVLTGSSVPSAGVAQSDRILYDLRSADGVTPVRRYTTMRLNWGHWELVGAAGEYTVTAYNLKTGQVWGGTDLGEVVVQDPPTLPEDECPEPGDDQTWEGLRAPGRAFAQDLVIVDPGDDPEPDDPCAVDPDDEPAGMLRAPGKAFVATTPLRTEGFDGQDDHSGPPPARIDGTAVLEPRANHRRTADLVEWARENAVRYVDDFALDPLVDTVLAEEPPEDTECLKYDDAMLLIAQDYARRAKSEFHSIHRDNKNWYQQQAFGVFETTTRLADVTGKSIAIATGVSKLGKLGKALNAGGGLLTASGRAAFKRAAIEHAADIAAKEEALSTGWKVTKMVTDTAERAANINTVVTNPGETFEDHVNTANAAVSLAQNAATEAMALDAAVGLTIVRDFLSPVGDMIAIRDHFREGRESLKTKNRITDALGESFTQHQVGYQFWLDRMRSAWQAYLGARYNPMHVGDCFPVDRLGPFHGYGVVPMDPNDIYGPEGVGAEHRVDPGSGMDYTIRFENVGPGTDPKPVGWNEVDVAGPARDVTVTMDIPANVDAASVALGRFGFGMAESPMVFQPEPGAQSFTVAIPYGVLAESNIQSSDDDEGGDDGEMLAYLLTLHATAVVDSGARTITWRIWLTHDCEGFGAGDAGCVPGGENPLQNPNVGFLLPEPGDDPGGPGAGSGQGFAQFSAVAPATAGPTVTAQASIVFNDEGAIATNVWSNRIGTSPVNPPVDPGPQNPGGASDAGGSSGGADIDVMGASTDRIAGANRYETAALIAQEFGRANAVIVANGEQAKQGFDALAANYLAGAVAAPIVLTPATSLPPSTAAAVRAVLAGSAEPTIFVMGGTDSVSAAVEAQLNAIAAAMAGKPGTYTQRIAGADRYETATKATGAGVGVAAGSGDFRATPAVPSGVAFLASGEVNADALAAGAISAGLGIPVLLTSRAALPPATLQAIRSHRITSLIVLGGPDRISQAVLDAAKAAGVTQLRRVAGADRFATSALLATLATGTLTGADGKHYGGGNTAYLANGVTGFPDALAIGPLAAKHGHLLLTVPTGTLPKSVAGVLRNHKSTVATVVGLGAAPTVADAVLDAAGGAIG